MIKNTLVYGLALAMCLMFINVHAKEEGIKVHGHWKFDIFHADGNFDRSVEFNNALTSTGEISLVSLLAKNQKVTGWSIQLFGNTPPCVSSSNQPFPCIIREVGVPINHSHEFSTLIVANSTDKLILQGSIVTGSGLSSPQISQVSSYIEICDLTNNPTCNPTNGILFTSKSITPVSLLPGQVVQVEVEFSFS